MDFETVLVDSGSTDNSLDFVAERFPEVRLIPLGENRGFSGAVNAGIESSNSEYVVLLNNDTEQDPGWLAALVDGAERFPEAALFASKLLDFDDRDILDGAGDALRRNGLPYRLGHREDDSPRFDRERYVFGACAAAALYRRSLFEEIGTFDEDFFAYCEDGDISFRAQLAGHRCLYVPSAVVYHVGSASTGGKRSAAATRLGTRNGLLLLAKDLPAPLLIRWMPSIILGQFSRLLVAISSGVGAAHLKGLAEAWRMLPTMLKKRAEIQKQRKVSDGYLRELLHESSRQAARSRLRRIQDELRRRIS
jgi:GT2 family glycosyltransferase